MALAESKEPDSQVQDVRRGTGKDRRKTIYQSEMKERGILYSAPMIMAKLAGTKTQTRRTVGLDAVNVNPNDWEYVFENGKHRFNHEDGESGGFVTCRYGKPGDILYARETWYRSYNSIAAEAAGFSDYIGPAYEYRADNQTSSGWKPSIHMPKKAARIWERITDIRVERLNDISEADAIAEGIKQFPEGYIFNNYTEDAVCKTAVESYRTLWESINGDGSWELNPWVWAITTETLSTTGRPKDL
jgi:hypothetical protein